MGKYDGWDPFFSNLGDDDVTLSFAQLEELIRAPLPPSALSYSVWWSSGQYHAVWKNHGFRASPDVVNERVRFRRIGRAPEPGYPTSGSLDPEAERLILLGCVSQKRSEAAPARDLYTSDLWTKRRQYAESSGQPWAILSAEHGLVEPETVVAPYDRSLKDEPMSYRRRWSADVTDAVIRHVRNSGIDTVEVHAGASYLENGLIEGLEEAGCEVVWPLRGLRIGEQLAWYSKQVEDPPASAETAVETFGQSPENDDRAPVILDMKRIGLFGFRWPDSVEVFESGWEGRAEIGGMTVAFKHGVGSRVVYDAERTHTVTWIGGSPVVEGVACDDYSRSRSLLSRIKKAGGSIARSSDEIPPGYESFVIVDHRSEIDAPYSPYGLAVKLREDDVAGWLHAAAIRQTVRSKAPQRSDRAQPSESTRSARLPLDTSHKAAVAEALVDFGEQERADRLTLSTPSEFSGDPAADELIRTDPFAFLVAVICDQGVKAERAWAAPLALTKRLGHLSPARMAAEHESVRMAFQQPTPLHRFIENVPRWVVAAARRVVDGFDGDAGRIWGDEPRAVDLQATLRSFEGIGQKKAAMAVEILERDLGVVIRDMEGSDIAYDIHIRRVFLRAGLAERDDQDHMIQEARRAWPDRPGALDGPAWVIGRTWCRPSNPLCQACPLDEVCAHLIGASEGVFGV